MSRDTQTDGRKEDAEKPRYDLIPFKALAVTVDVLTFGAELYGPENWRRMLARFRQWFRDFVAGTSHEQRLAILTLLAERPRVAFFLAKQSNGSVLPRSVIQTLKVLATMKDDGLIDHLSENAPGEGALRCYMITDAGRAWLATSEDEGSR